MTDADAFLRKTECEVLDAWHLGLPLMRRPRGEALYGIMASLDSMTLPIVLGPAAPSTFGHAQRIKNLEEGFSQAMKWLHPSGGVRPLPRSEDGVFDDAGEFLLHAGEYSDIADFHRMMGRGHMVVDVEPASRHIRFNVVNGGTFNHAVGFGENVDADIRRFVTPKLSEFSKVRAAIESICRRVRHDLVDGRIVLTDWRQLKGPDIELREWAAERDDQPYLKDEIDLGGYSVAEFKRFWGSVARWSRVAVDLFLDHVMQRRTPQHQCMPTQVIRRDEFIRAVSEMAEIDDHRCAAIVDRLTAGEGEPASEVFLQPFIGDRDVIAWSTWAVSNARSLRNHLKLLARLKSTRQFAATVIGAMERPFLQDVGRLLSQRGYAYQLTTEIDDGAEKGEVDLIAATSRASHEVLLVEGKTLLDPDEINEVDQATKEMQGAQEQLRRVRRLLQRLGSAGRPVAKFVCLSDRTEWYPIVITPRAEPNGVYDHEEIPAISFEVLRTRYRASDFARPHRIWEAARSRPWLPRFESTVVHRTIMIGDVTYSLPVVEIGVDD